MPFISAANSSFWAGARPGSVTNPNILPNLQVWYDASDSLVFTPSNPTDGSTFTQWGDKSAFAHNANTDGGGTARPTYETNEQNGLSVVRFDGVNDNLTINPASWAANLSAVSYFVVAKITNTTGTRTLISSDQNGQKISFNGTNWTVSQSGGIGVSTVVGDTTKFHIFAFLFDGSQTGNTNRLRFRYGETEQTLSFTGTVGATTNASTSAVNLGHYNKTEYFAGDIAEVVFFSRPVTSSEIGGLESYLSNKWAI